jgi:hypothetical protein
MPPPLLPPPHTLFHAHSFLSLHMHYRYTLCGGGGWGGSVLGLSHLEKGKCFNPFMRGEIFSPLDYEGQKLVTLIKNLFFKG